MVPTKLAYLIDRILKYSRTLVQLMLKVQQ